MYLFSVGLQRGGKFPVNFHGKLSLGILEFFISILEINGNYLRIEGNLIEKT